MEADRQLVVVDAELGAVLRVDPASGDRTVILDTSGDLFPPVLGGLAVEGDGNLLVSANGGGDALNAIQRLCPATSNLILLSGQLTDEPVPEDFPSEGSESGFKAFDPRVNPPLE